MDRSPREEPIAPHAFSRESLMHVANYCMFVVNLVMLVFIAKWHQPWSATWRSIVWHTVVLAWATIGISIGIYEICLQR